MASVTAVEPLVSASTIFSLNDHVYTVCVD